MKIFLTKEILIKRTRYILECAVEKVVIGLDFINLAIESLVTYIIGKDHQLNAKFGNASFVFKRKHTSFSVSGNLYLSLEQARQNMVIIAPSGGGKTQVGILPSIYNISKNLGSMLVNDPSGELSRFIPYLKSLGYQVIELDFSAKHPTAFYNPLARCTSSAQANKIASTLVRASEGKKSSNSSGNFFSKKALEVIGMMINFLRESCDAHYLNLANVFYLLEVLQAEPKKIDLLFSGASEKVWLKYKSLKAMSDDTRSSVIATAQSVLSFIGNDSQLEGLTAKDSIDFESFRSKPVACFIRVPLGDVAYYKTIVGLFFEDYFTHVFNKLPSKGDKDVHIILEELSSIGSVLSDFPNYIANARKFNIPICGVLQSENQLHEAFGQFNAKTILNNFNVKCYFSGLTDEAERLERVLGKYSYKENKDDKSFKTRSLMTSDEIQTMDKDRLLVLVTGTRPLLIKTKPAYRQARLMAALNYSHELLIQASNPIDSQEIIKYLPIDELIKPIEQSLTSKS